MAQLRRVVMVLVAAVALVLFGAGGAGAHAELVSITPDDFASLSSPPTAVVLVFTEPVPVQFAVVRVTDASGGVVSVGRVAESGATLTQPLRADLGAGTYTVVWKVTADDGHVTSGDSTFTVTGGASASPSSTGTPSSAPPSTTSPATTKAGSTPTAGLGSSSSHDDPSPTWPSAIGLVVLATLVATGIAMTRRPSKSFPK